MIEGLIEYSARNRFLVILFVVIFTLLGIWSARNISLDAIPDLSDVQVIIFTEWPGRSPNLVEDQVTYPIVSSMLAVPRSTAVRGFSFLGLSFVYVLFEDGTDIYWARSRVMEYLSGITGDLPDGIQPRLGPDATGVGWGFEYALVDRTGQNDLQQLRSFQDWYLRYWLQAVDGVAEVASVGGFEKQYQIEIDPNKLAAYHLPFKHVIMNLRRSNNDVGGRVLEMAGREYFIRGFGYIRSVEDIEQTVVGVDDNGTPILLRDVAAVHLGPNMRRGAAELDGEGEVVGGIVVVRFGENVLKVVDRVKERLGEIESSLPPGVEVVVTYDRSDLIHRSIENLRHKIIEELIVVSLVVILFLLHLPSALVAIIILPVAVAMSFLPMFGLKISSNIMSLGGIGLAIGAMVDAVVVLIENAHKKAEHEPHDLVEGEDGLWHCPRDESHVHRRPGVCPRCRQEIIIEASKEVGKPLFFSLLIITVSFLPVFTLEQQEGRLFKPLAYTKTFSMFFAALLSVTLAPALMIWFIRGRLVHENRHPISKRLQRVYYPWVSALMRRRALSISIAVIAVVSCLPLIPRLGSEFMPPLNEGDMLYMPTTPPGISITEATHMLQIQDRIIRQFPEVDVVFGKVGRARTSTDPAPLSMVETNIILKRDPDEWAKVRVERWYSGWAPGWLQAILRPLWPDERPRTWDELRRALDSVAKFPGWTNSWTMPIKTRIDMLTTGIRTPVGIKIFGPELPVIEEIGTELEGIITRVPGTLSVYAERVTGGYFVDFHARREAAARYGLTVEDVQDMIMTAIGGMVIDSTVEGRERYTIQVRYSRDFRSSLEALQRVLVPTPAGAQVPMAQLADLRVTTGPPVIKNEDGMLTGWVFVDLAGRDIGSYVADAKQAVAEQLTLPSGYTLKWAGQYEFMQRVAAKMRIVIPITLAIIVVMLFMNFGSVAQTFIVLLSVPFAVTGSVWFMYLYNRIHPEDPIRMSIAVWVGIIALAGVAAETGVVMIVYLDEAVEMFRRRGRLRNQYDLFAAITYGAVQRVRPKLMTVMTTITGLLPLLYGTGAGGDVMRRLAAPMVGGLITSTILTLEIVPAIYSLWRQRQVRWVRPERPEDEPILYYCPLHPEVQHEEHGQCPECGMYLQEYVDPYVEEDPT